MLLLILPSEDGPFIRFFPTEDELLLHFGDGEGLPERWLTFEEAQEDSYYWPEGSAFLATVTRRELVAEVQTVRWRVK
jgi:hypothetical protein